MNVVKYGKWEISVDLEKTKEYYQNYVINKNQANRNFARCCELLTEEEKVFLNRLQLYHNVVRLNTLA